MAITVFSVDTDHVINGKVISGKTNYQFAIDKLVPLVERLDIQREIQNSRFYKRLEKDILNGCIMPPLTLAFVSTTSGNVDKLEELEQFINTNIEQAFVLDGIQRLNTLNRAFKENSHSIDIHRPIFLNIIICESSDNLLYRMITLNNGQKPMTARHQIEILTSNLYDFEGVKLKVGTEKEKKNMSDAFSKAEFIKAYLAFIANAINIDNQKLIEEKMDEVIANKILDSNPTEDKLQFSQVIQLIERYIENPLLKQWFKAPNNLIGFCVGIKKSYDTVKESTVEEFAVATEEFEKAFKSFDLSKIKLGFMRRKLVEYFIKNFDELKDKDEWELAYILSTVD